MKILFIPGDFILVDGRGSYITQQHIHGKVGVILKETTESVNSPKKYSVKLFNQRAEQSLFENEFSKITKEDYDATIVLES